MGRLAGKLRGSLVGWVDMFIFRVNKNRFQLDIYKRESLPLFYPPISKRVTPPLVGWSEIGERSTDHQKQFVRSKRVEWSETTCHSTLTITSIDFVQTREYHLHSLCAYFGQVICESTQPLSYKLWVKFGRVLGKIGEEYQNSAYYGEVEHQNHVGKIRRGNQFGFKNII